MIETPTTLQQIEGVVGTRPAVALFQLQAEDGNTPLNEAGRMADAMQQEPLWQRIEQWVAHRWHERTVVWIVEGCGEWIPPLTPITGLSAERWDGAAWQPVTLDAAPLGYYLPIDGHHRVTATVGASNPPPADVEEALRRLVFYAAQLFDDPGGAMTSGDLERPAAWPARAMQLSGAADLLRNYRSVY